MTTELRRRYRLAWTHRGLDPDCLRRDYQDYGGREYIVVGPGRIEVSPFWLCTDHYAVRISAALGVPDDEIFRAFLARLIEDAEEARLARHDALDRLYG